MQALIVKTSALGDVVQALEALTWLLDEIKTPVSIDWVVEKPASSLVALHPAVQHIHVIDTKGWRSKIFQPATWSSISQSIRLLRFEDYDVAIDLQGNVKSAICMQLSRCQKRVGLGKGACAEWPACLGLNTQVYPDYSWGARGVYTQLLAEGLGIRLDKESMERMLQKANHPPQVQWRFDEGILEASQRLTGSGTYGLVALGSRWPNKQVNPTLAIPIIQHLITRRPHEKIYLVWGSKEEQETALKVCQTIAHPRVQVLPKESLLVLAHVIQKAQWMVSADSLALHLGSWMGTATFGIFGPSSGSYYGSRGSRHAFWQGFCPYGSVFDKRCNKLRTCSTGACLKGVSAQPLLQVLDAWIGNLG